MLTLRPELSNLGRLWGERNAINLAVHNQCACIPVSFYNSEKAQGQVTAATGACVLADFRVKLKGSSNHQKLESDKDTLL